MRMTALLLLVACGGPGNQAHPAPIQNLAPGTRTGAVGIPAIDEAAFAHLLEARSWAQVIDPAVGVVEMRAVSTPVDDAEGEFWARRLCGDRAATGADAIANAIAARAHGELRAEYTTGCQ